MEYSRPWYRWTMLNAEPLRTQQWRCRHPAERSHAALITFSPDACYLGSDAQASNGDHAPYPRRLSLEIAPNALFQVLNKGSMPLIIREHAVAPR